MALKSHGAADVRFGKPDGQPTGWGRAVCLSAAIHGVGVLLLCRLGLGDAMKGVQPSVSILPVSLVSPTPPDRMSVERPSLPTVDWTPERSLPEWSPAVVPEPVAAPDVPMEPPSFIRASPRVIDYSAAIPSPFETPMMPASPPGGGGGGEGAIPPDGAGSYGAQPLNLIRPVYPRNARRDGLEGVVTVRAEIDKKGGVERVDVLESSGVSSLDEAALTAIRGTSFKPATRAGQPVSGVVNLRIRFQLTDLESAP